MKSSNRATGTSTATAFNNENSENTGEKEHVVGNTDAVDNLAYSPEPAMTDKEKNEGDGKSGGITPKLTPKLSNTLFKTEAIKPSPMPSQSPKHTPTPAPMTPTPAFTPFVITYWPEVYIPEDKIMLIRINIDTLQVDKTELKLIRIDNRSLRPLFEIKSDGSVTINSNEIELKPEDKIIGLSSWEYYGRSVVKSTGSFMNKKYNDFVIDDIIKIANGYTGGNANSNSEAIGNTVTKANDNTITNTFGNSN